MRVQASIDHNELPTVTWVSRLEATEGLSELFDVRVQVLCAEVGLDLETILWSTACVTVAPLSPSAVARSFHGVIEEARYEGQQVEGAGTPLHGFSFRLRPSIHGLHYRVRSRIFQNLNAVDIIKQVLEEAGIAADSTRWDTTSEYPEREYCAQWKESELDFVQRLLEEEGIFYWFEHTELEHTLCFGDAETVHRPIEGDPSLPFGSDSDPDHETVWALVQESRLVHDGARSRDWYFENPDQPRAAEVGDEAARRRYEYPGRFRDDSEGARLMAARLQALRHPAIGMRGRSTSTRLAPGRKALLLNMEPDFLAGEYTVQRVRHELHPEPAGDPQNGAGGYTCTFQAYPSDLVFRPPRSTPRPVAHGLESAVVTGPAGEEIHVDAYGRIKVHFYWDRENPVDDTASCWVRFQQLNTQGAMILPRVGWEVHIAFENGDPDRPIALHKAYNQETMPPYGLPANKTQSSLQSSTSPGGGTTNEIRMQDGSGGMEWFLHSSKDLNVLVANDENETVGVDAVETVGNTLNSTVGADETGSVGANQSFSVAEVFARETVGSKTVSIGGNDDWGVTGSFGFTTTGSRDESIGGLMNVLANKVAETINGSLTRSVGAVQVVTSATAIAETVGGNKTESVGAAKAVLTPAEYAEAIGGAKTLTSGAVVVKTGGDVSYSAKGALAITAAGVISITAADDAVFSGSQVRVTCGTAQLKGGGGKLKLGGSLTVDAKKFGGKSGPLLKIKGNLDYKD
ncbi:MAG: type VI secretion system Vgr family protein [Sandaracinaceae bacterium]